MLSDAGSVPVPVPPMPFSRIVTRARLRAVRREIGIAAAGAGLADQVTAGFVLAVQELMTNAVRHGGGWARVRLHRSGSALVCVVSDRGPGLTGDPRRVGTLAGARSAGGRGLFLAREMTDSLEVRSGPSGVTVTVTMGLPG
ncbi:hypothetical protein MB27_21465 [Actinoplanes utahensis]|uniref:Histidine kinase/HSP90-like ATPase domain-containing protein n=1 Tax=Actinoplanes utahensis TaxID=1869 RepID=A0A0A6UKQ1_ACTUT|nr:hypothetical protein MB27_21465 [Actinoplanes utahensis]